MRRFFFDHTQFEPAKPLASIGINSTTTLPDSITYHWCKVLRAKVGDTAILFDGLGGQYQAILTQIQKKSAEVRLTNYTPRNNTPQFYSKIGLVMSRGDRMDYAIQKATEMGVTAIQLLTSHHGEVRLKPAQVEKKLNHWQQVALSACEQCGLNLPPIIYAPMSINDWLTNDSQITSTCHYMQAIEHSTTYQLLTQPADIKLMLSVPTNNQPAVPNQLIQLIKNKTDKPYIQLLIGAEGGLSEDETNQAKNGGWQAWQIGSRVLRTETAPVVALATLQAWYDTL